MEYGCKLGQLLWKSVCMFLNKLKVGLPSDQVIKLLGVYPKAPKSMDCRDAYTSGFSTVSFTIAQLWNQPERSTSENGQRKCMYTQWDFLQP